ncbi:unnamed protein product [Ixodes persulcatus]
MEVIRSNKGKAKVLLDGYDYVQKQSKNGWIRWQCRKQRTGGCKGAITTDHAITRFWSVMEHNHASDVDGVKVTKVRMNLKRKARETSEPPSKLLAQALCSSSAAVRANLGSLETVRRDLRQQRSRLRPAEPESTAKLEVDGIWATTGGEVPQPFLIYDNGSERRDRMLVFASSEQLRALSTSPTWYMDGTFSVCPRLFKQLYVLRCAVGESSVACVYALLAGKSLAIYEELFRAVLDACEARGYLPDPSVIVSDYEMAAIRAAREVFGPDFASRGCFFHLCQSTHRKVRELGLINRYRTDDAFRKACGMLDGLAFVPPDLVPSGLQHIRDMAPDGMAEILAYFDSTYVNGTFRTVSRAGADGRLTTIVRRRRPEFPPELWNVMEATLQGEDRTNNACEGWNNAFKHLVGHSHPSVWRLIECLQQDQAVAGTTLLQVSRGEPPAKKTRRETSRLQNRLHHLCTDYLHHKQLPVLLEAAGQCIRF